MDNKEELKKRYMRTFELLIDCAFKDKPQAFQFCDGIVLELYEENDELHWRLIGGTATDR